MRCLSISKTPMQTWLVQQSPAGVQVRGTRHLSGSSNCPGGPSPATAEELRATLGTLGSHPSAIHSQGSHVTHVPYLPTWYVSANLRYLQVSQITPGTYLQATKSCPRRVLPSHQGELLKRLYLTVSIDFDGNNFTGKTNLKWTVPRDLNAFAFVICYNKWAHIKVLSRYAWRTLCCLCANLSCQVLRLQLICI